MKFDFEQMFIGGISWKIVSHTIKRLGFNDLSIQAGLESLNFILKSVTSFIVMNYLIIAYKRNWLDDKTKTQFAAIVIFMTVAAIISKKIKGGTLKVETKKALTT